MLSAIAASLSLLVAGQLALGADVAATTRARWIAFEGGTERGYGELEALPRVSVTRRGGALGLEAFYGPRLFLPLDLSSGSKDLESWSTVRDRGELLHGAGIVLQDTDPRGPNLRVVATGSYGLTDLLRASDWGPQPLPTTERVRFLSLRGTAELSGRPSPRTTLLLRSGGFAVGGADSASRETVPLQRGLTLESSAAWDATRRDVLSAEVAGTYSWLSTPSEAAHARAGARWRRRLDPSLSSRLVAGLSWAWSDAPDPDVRGLGPWMEAALSYARGSRLDAEVSVRLEPGIDAATGLVDQRIEGAVQATWRTSRTWILGVRGSAAAAGPTPSGARLAPDDLDTRLGTFEMSATRPLGSRTTLSFGALGRFQDSSRVGLPSFREWGGFVRFGTSVGVGDEPPGYRVAPSE